MAKGRPVEELPRILGMLSPAHHLVSAMALDRLFQVEPPEPAINIREAFLQAQFLRHHLRKLYFFLSSKSNPFSEYAGRAIPATATHIPHQILTEIMLCVALAQEAATILGGRADHPLSAAPGGVSRFLKDIHYDRLSEIAAHCVQFCVKLAAILRERVFGASEFMEELSRVSFTPMAFLATSDKDGDISVRSQEGSEIDRIRQDTIFEKIGLHQEDWSYEPFAFLKDKGWPGLEQDNSGGLYFVGPLARLNSAVELDQPLAEQERQSLVEALGAFPHFGVAAAYWSLLVEAIQAAEKMAGLYSQEKLTGPTIRNVPSGVCDVGYASLESPQGLISHYYRVDDRAIVTEIEILDTSAENNALFCFLAQKRVDECFQQGCSTEDIKKGIEVSLLPF
jgi:F420-non-reducing hydrogenase large subunit